MKTQTLSKSSLFLGAVLGAVITIGLYTMLATSDNDGGMSSADEAKPLYWVAPMDANYQRDKPGKSPMGMDLVPVYAESADDGMEQAGSVRISPDVINNLGVRVSESRLQVMHNEITTVGYVQYDQDQLVHIHPRVEGWIEKLYVKAAGDPVAYNQALYALYSPQLVNAQEEFLLALDRKNTRLIEAAESRLMSLQIPVSEIKRLKADKSVSQTVTFYAPQSGVVDNLNIREGFYVKPGTTLMSIGKLEQVWVEAEIFERQAAEVAVAMPVTMTLDYLPGREWSGMVDYVQPTVDPQTRTIKLRLRFANADGVLKPNMFAQVVIHTENDQRVLVVPKESLIRTGKMDRVVLALGEGRFKSIEVNVGRFDADSVEILDGLVAGDKVVTSAQFLLDSESSKSSDFVRMHHQQDTDADMADENAHDSASAEGVINNISHSQRRVNISRGPIEKWGRGPATLDFLIQDALDISQLTENSKVRFTFYMADGEFIITHIDDAAAEASASKQHNEERPE
jgi:Cu(I)/Ag(I) efflux system membrane fusion protein